ncbi:unnamed protein product [Periconia digitata]|uniref:Uncharacterized protein n=1 Tax=Periconia digitata TaxID=1303443 RepID=A0A9W4UPC6_9PLEO|nr:unnamed protein product [Periconia digitata]
MGGVFFSSIPVLPPSHGKWAIHLYSMCTVLSSYPLLTPHPTANALLRYRPNLQLDSVHAQHVTREINPHSKSAPAWSRAPYTDLLSSLLSEKDAILVLHNALSCTIYKPKRLHILAQT